jgi:phosphate-selective porin OprO/OprP
VTAWVGLVLIALFWMCSLQVAWSVEPNFGYYDDVPPIDQSEIDALAERTREARKRLKRPDVATAVKPESIVPTAPLPSPAKDERNDVPAIDLEEVDELRKAFQEIQAQAPKSEAPAEQRTPAGGPQTPPAKSQSQKELEQEITSLTERLNAVERVLVGTEDRPGLAGLIGGWTRQNGFFLMSSAGDFVLRLPVLFQADYRGFPGGQNGANPGVQPSTFILQRARPMVHVRVWRYFHALITPDFGNGVLNLNAFQNQSVVQIPDGFAEWDYFSAFRIRVGKFKSPIGLEMLQGIQNLSFMERSLTRNLLPNRDVGAMAWGVFQRGALEYQVGVFNGAPNANFYQDTNATNSSKTVEARAFTRPFINRSQAWLRGLGFGVGMSFGDVQNASGQENMQTETLSYTFFQYKSPVQGMGNRTRISPQAAWYWGRFGTLAQYVVSQQRLGLSSGGPSFTTSNDAWSVQGSVFLTDDTATFGHVMPRRPVDPSQGHWGAWELAVRYAQINLDPNNFVFGLADPTINVERAKSSTVGLSWYLNSNIRIVGNFVHTDFTGATRAYHAASHEDGLMFRTQLTF